MGTSIWEIVFLSPRGAYFSSPKIDSVEVAVDTAIFVRSSFK